MAPSGTALLARLRMDPALAHPPGPPPPWGGIPSLGGVSKMCGTPPAVPRPRRACVSMTSGPPAGAIPVRCTPTATRSPCRHPHGSRPSVFQPCDRTRASRPPLSPRCLERRLRRSGARADRWHHEPLRPALPTRCGGLPLATGFPLRPPRLPWAWHSSPVPDGLRLPPPRTGWSGPPPPVAPSAGRARLVPSDAAVLARFREAGA